jgi:hypothetical protein
MGKHAEIHKESSRANGSVGSSSLGEISGENKHRPKPENREEKHNWFWNLFYVFFFPYVFGKEPLTSDDIPDVTRDARAKEAHKQASNLLQPKYDEYVLEIDKFSKGLIS